MANRQFTQEELNLVVQSRLQRERGRTHRIVENALKRCMAAVHLTLYEEMRALKRDMAAEMKDTLLSGGSNPESNERPANPAPENTARPPSPAGGGDGQ